MRRTSFFKICGVSPESGFSVLELLIAISILAVGLLGTASILSTGIGADRFAHTVTVENSLCSSIVEEFLARQSNDAIFDADVVDIAYDLDPASAATTLTVQGRTYSATYTIDEANPVAGVATVQVTVTSGGRAVTMTTLKSTI